MTQNIYDQPTFFEGYSRLPRSVEGLDAAPEWPALRALLPNLAGASVLDLGCGFGWFCRAAREMGAGKVLGIDVSENMLARARAATVDGAISYAKGDLEQVVLQPNAFDLIYSSLAFHYVENLERLMGEVSRALVPGGRFVFSVEHPIYTAPSTPGWTIDAAGRTVWPVDGYLDESPRTTDWLAKGVIKQHRTIGSYLNLLIGLGVTIVHVEEWGPTPAQIAAQPALADERQRPAFLLVAGRK
ncbi:class I SAM-dependent methyltransferase [Phreatobacter stygius]|uniref:Class I SAM-dependent methyltransferase n=1 Tax=Phreatobacter stygius TaxID=1940610 RepID=A0A4D7B999_9HYPH|nr:class I SAM-dependent methyltransferase [Phreatobacter stygius]QCI67475.1 class I SAM-dependent methyltransferase [Phreatobacter stygius]